MSKRTAIKHLVKNIHIKKAGHCPLNFNFPPQTHRVSGRNPCVNDVKITPNNYKIQISFKKISN